MALDRVSARRVGQRGPVDPSRRNCAGQPPRTLGSLRRAMRWCRRAERRRERGPMIFSKLMGQFVDVIQWTDDSPDTMVWRFERQGNEIKYGAKLTVREGQMAVFVNEGEIADTFTPGMYELFTRNLPILSHAAGLAARLREPVQGRGLFLQHAHLHRPEMGHQEPGDRARRRVRAGAAARLRHLRDPDQGPVRVPARGRRHRRPLHRRRDQRPAAQHHRRPLRHDRRGLGHPGARPRRQLRPARPVRARAGSRPSSPITASS